MLDDAQTHLWSRCDDRGFTPGVRDVPALLELWDTVRGSDGIDGIAPRAAAKRVIKALGRGDAGVANALLDGLGDHPPERRVIALRVAAKIAGRSPIPALQVAAMDLLLDEDPRVQREAARAVGKAEADSVPPSTQQRLLEILGGDDLAAARAAAEALGRVGGPEHVDRLRGPFEDPELQRVASEAALLLSRKSDRHMRGALRLDRELPKAITVLLPMRAGAAGVVEAQVAALLPDAVDLRRALPPRKNVEAIALSWQGPLESLLRVRSALSIALAFPLPAGEERIARSIAALQQSDLVATLVAYTEGAPRFRLSFADGRHRASIWRVAEALEALDSPLRNDTREVLWNVEIDPPRDRVVCTPRVDPRFEYRVADVPAASHPTLAALLAWVAAPQSGETVWDPFCGSGSELIECARLCEGLHLRGSDLSGDALAASATNFEAAGPTAASHRLVAGNALELHPSELECPPIDVIVSNPPMGRRVASDGSMRQLLTDFVHHAKTVLAPGGRIVWLSPSPSSTAKAAGHAGFDVEDRGDIDMGGFTAGLQVLRLPS